MKHNGITTERRLFIIREDHLTIKLKPILLQQTVLLHHKCGLAFKLSSPRSLQGVTTPHHQQTRTKNTISTWYALVISTSTEYDVLYSLIVMDSPLSRNEKTSSSQLYENLRGALRDTL